MKDVTRLVMPLMVSIPAVIGAYYSFQAIIGDLFLPAFTGFVIGYLIYDFLHFASHFMIFPYNWFKVIKKII